MTSNFKLYYKHDKMSISNYNLFYPKKDIKNFRIAQMDKSIDIIYITKLIKFRFFNVITTILTKIIIIPILLININTFFQ